MGLLLQPLFKICLCGMCLVVLLGRFDLCAYLAAYLAAYQIDILTVTDTFLDDSIFMIFVFYFLFGCEIIIDLGSLTCTADGNYGLDYIVKVV